MLNIVRMDFYRLFHSKAFRVGIIAATLVSLVGMLLYLGILEIIKLTLETDPEATEGLEVFFSVIYWLDGVDFADIVFKGTNAFSLFVSCMIVASFVGAEQSCGYIKNIAGQLSNRGKTVISKYIVTCFVQLSVILIFTLVSSLCAVFFFKSYITGYSIATLIEGLALRFLLFCAINAVVLFFCTLTKSHAIAMVVGAIYGISVTSLVYLAASAILGMLKISVDIAKLMPDGINGLISVADLNTVAVRAIIVSVAFIGCFLTGSVVLFNKRDV